MAYIYTYSRLRFRSKIPSRVFCASLRNLHKFAYAHVQAGSLNSTESVMSGEPGRKTAYSNDLRWRIVYQRIAINLCEGLSRGATRDVN